MKLIELFGGIGACTKAFKNIGMNVDVVDYVEIDKYAVKSYNAINGTNFEPQDIKEWDKDINVDIIMHGSPCQDFSVAGKQAGGDLGSGTRSSLLYETIRIVGKLRPKYVIWENVKNLLSKKHKHNFDNYIETMNILGYNSYYQVLNAKDYGIPQNRERVYTISIRKDIDNGNFKFPEKEELKLRLKDILEDEVEKKYYLSDYKVSKIEKSNFMQEKKRIQEKDYCDTLCARDWKDPKCVRIGGIFDTEKLKHQAGSIYDKEGLGPTLDAMQGGWRQPSIVEEPKIITHNIIQTVKVRKYSVNTEKLVEVLRNAKIEQDLTNSRIAFELDVPITTVEHWFRKDSSFAIPDENIWFKLKKILNIQTNEFDESIMTFEEKEGVYDKSNRVYDENGIAPTLMQQEEKILENQIRIRKLTPKECWRLMGFDDEDFDRAEKVNSNTQLYKQARKLNSCKCS